MECKENFLKASEDLHEAHTRINARKIARILAGGATHGLKNRKRNKPACGKNHNIGRMNRLLRG